MCRTDNCPLCEVPKDELERTDYSYQLLSGLAIRAQVAAAQAELLEPDGSIKHCCIGKVAHFHMIIAYQISYKFQIWYHNISCTIPYTYELWYHMLYHIIICNIICKIIYAFLHCRPLNGDRSRTRSVRSSINCVDTIHFFVPKTCICLRVAPKRIFIRSSPAGMGCTFCLHPCTCTCKFCLCSPWGAVQIPRQPVGVRCNAQVRLDAPKILTEFPGLLVKHGQSKHCLCNSLHKLVHQQHTWSRANGREPAGLLKVGMKKQHSLASSDHLVKRI